MLPPRGPERALTTRGAQRGPRLSRWAKQRNRSAAPAPAAQVSLGPRPRTRAVAVRGALRPRQGAQTRDRPWRTPPSDRREDRTRQPEKPGRGVRRGLHRRDRARPPPHPGEGTGRQAEGQTWPRGSRAGGGATALSRGRVPGTGHRKLRERPGPRRDHISGSRRGLCHLCGHGLRRGPRATPRDGSGHLPARNQGVGRAPSRTGPRHRRLRAHSEGTRPSRRGPGAILAIPGTVATVWRAPCDRGCQLAVCPPPPHPPWAPSSQCHRKPASTVLCNSLPLLPFQADRHSGPEPELRPRPGPQTGPHRLEAAG